MLEKKQLNIWDVVSKNIYEVIKILFSIILAVAGSKTVTTVNNEERHAGYRNGHGGYGHYDSNDQKIHSDDV